MHKILCFSNDSRLTGGPSSLLDLLTCIDRSRYLPLVVTPNDGPLVEELRRQRVEVRIVRTIERLYGSSHQASGTLLTSIRRLLVNVWLTVRLYSLIRRTRADLVYLNTSAARYASIASKLSGLPVVWHVREYREDGLRRRVFTRYIRLMCDRTIANSKAVRDMWNPKWAASKIRVIYNGIDVSKASSVSESSPVARTSRQAPVLGYVGQIHKVKGLEVLVGAVEWLKQDFPKIRCSIIGAAPKSQANHERYLKDLIRKRRLEGHFDFLGERRDVLRLLSQIDVLVLPSVSESFGRVLIEAMAMAKPVVASRVGGVPEVVVDGVTGFLVPPGDSKILAEAIMSLISDPQKATRFGRMGKIRVQKMFDLERYHRQIEAVFAELLDLPSG